MSSCPRSHGRNGFQGMSAGLPVLSYTDCLLEVGLAFAPAQKPLTSPSSIFRNCFSFLATSFRKSLEFR